MATLNCSFLDRMTTQRNLDEARGFIQKVSGENKNKNIADLFLGALNPDSDATAYQLAVFGEILNKTIYCMDNGGGRTITEGHAKQAAAACGFSLPEGNDLDASALTLSQGLFQDFVHEYSIQVLQKDLKTIEIEPEAWIVLQTVFESLNQGAYKATPNKGGRTIQLESPTGVRAVIFEPNWNEEQEECDGDEEEDEDAMAEEEEDIELEADDDEDEEHDLE